jgi:DEAD/DEAH box helicase domain-containing protein
MNAATSFDTLERIGRRSTAAVVGWAGLKSQSLRRHLLETLPGTGHAGAFVADPVIEAVHGWEVADQTFGELSGSLLRPSLVDALDGTGLPKPDGRERYRLERSRRPYSHQLKAWNQLLAPEPRSILVSSGTGSGKTECFVVPMLEDLVREAEDRGGPIRGVRAIMIYPLNALINSQRERLSDWIAPFKGAIRFCLYNGSTPKDVPNAEQLNTPEEVRSRRLLRANPPPILVTNTTMLEYMLIRHEDQPIIQQSQGKLRYIVLDEAHSYVGSQAAELSLLLRRVTRAFGVSPSDVRFVATSATIGKESDPAIREALQRFLADVAGVPLSSVEVIEGKRSIPNLPPIDPSAKLPEANNGIDDLFDRLGRSPDFRRGFDQLRTKPMSLSQWCEAVGVDEDRGADILVAASQAQKDGRLLQPLKIHAFHRSQGGVWACPDPQCSGLKRTSLEGEDWPFGPVFHERIDQCPFCRTCAFELLFCTGCGTAILDAQTVFSQDGTERLTSRPPNPLEDEFLAELDDEVPDDDALNLSPDGQLASDEVLIVANDTSGGQKIRINPVTGQILEKEADAGLGLRIARERDQCPGCQGFFKVGNARLAHLRVGAPFLLGNIVPELLDDAAPTLATKDNKGPFPAEGRQLLTFTDSRQGTARLAAKLQAEAERNYVRALLYHSVQASPAIAPHQEAELQKKRELLANVEKTIAENPPLAATMAPIRDDLILGIQSLQPKERVLSWSDAIQAIKSDETCMRWIKSDIWGNRDIRFNQADDFAKFALLREVIRRPNKQNSIETMGLIRITFQEIERITTVPRDFSDRGGTLNDWKDFLTICTVRVLRGSYAVAVDPGILHWIAPKVPSKYVITWGDPRAGQRPHQVFWPQISNKPSARRPFMLSLLAQAFDVSFDEAIDREIIISIMESAWSAIQPVLIPAADGSQLNPERFNFAPLRNGAVCPLTRRVLDRTFKGLSPYPMLKSGGDVFFPASSVEMPQFPFPFRSRDGRQVSRTEIDDWAQTDECVASARERGVWTNLHDRIARFDAFYRSAEHSAQQPGPLLREYEREYRRGQINVLNCSTTMEMGVDIGSIGTVLNTNVPPSAASYRQRVGRAGRRGQSMALSVTLCKNVPTDLAVFRDPISLLTRTIAAPRVTLDSNIIVQRHVNAFLLGIFLAEKGAELQKLEAGAFFGLMADGTRMETGSSPGDKFTEWLESSECRQNLDLRAGVDLLLRGSLLEGKTDAAIDSSREAIADVRSAIEREWDAIRVDMTDLAGRDAAQMALQFQMRRLVEEFLLRELIKRSYLPGHGFPTDVVIFDTSTIHLNKRQDGSADDKQRRTTPREFPSRELDRAIRDYAPGADVVVDGVVYKSAGIRLDWKRPALETTVRDIQALRTAWRCERCGATDTSHNIPEVCPACAQSGSLKWYRYLRPSGFTCDPVEKPHAEVEKTDFIPSKLPWVTARGGEWMSLADASVGRFRASRSGMVFHHTLGARGYGYCICLDCGRAAEEDGPPHLLPPVPKSMGNHRPLRVTKKNGGRLICSGVEKKFPVQRHHALGYEVTTDVFEIQFEELEEVSVGLPIAVAMRDALARTLGIEAAEMGLGVTQTREWEGMPARWSIFLYDQASGGAGFSVNAAGLISDVIKGAADILNCPNGSSCRQGCSECILAKDVETYASTMEREKAFRFLTDKILPRLQIAPEDHLFGATTRLETQLLADSVLRQLDRDPTSKLFIWFDGPPSTWDLEHWSIVDVIRRLSLRGRDIDVIAREDVIKGLPLQERIALFGRVMKAGATLRVTPKIPQAGGGTLLAHVKGDARSVVWGTRDLAALQPSSKWGFPKLPLVRAEVPQVYHAGTAVNPADFLQIAPGASLVNIGRELDGPVDGFGAAFWSLLASKAPALAERIKAGESLMEVSYSDRYVFSPLTARLMHGLLERLPGITKDTVVRIQVGAFPNPRVSPYLVHHDWMLNDHRKQVMDHLLSSLSNSVTVTYLDKGQMEHARVLILRYSGAIVRILFDQGMGYWQSESAVRYDFGSNPTDQRRQAKSLKFRIKAGSHNPTWVVVSKEN